MNSAAIEMTRTGRGARSGRVGESRRRRRRGGGRPLRRNRRTLRAYRSFLTVFPFVCNKIAKIHAGKYKPPSDNDFRDANNPREVPVNILLRVINHQILE